RLLARDAELGEMCSNLAERECRVAVEPDEGADALTQPFVRPGDDRNLPHTRMLQQELLDLTRRDVLTTAHDDVLLAIHDRHVALVVDHTDVTTPVEALGSERVGVE